MPDLPTHEQQRGLCSVVARALVEIRSLARESGNRQIEELADAFHNMPRDMFEQGAWNHEFARGALLDYGNRYKRSGYVSEFDQVMAG